jgi:hypothetical protein
MTGLKISIQAEVRNGDGKLLKRTRKRFCKSYVRGIVDLLYALGISSSVDFQDTSNATKTLDLIESATAGALGKMDAPAENDLFGIQVGTGATTPDVEDYCLTTKILHGATSGKLSYGDVAIGVVAIIATTAKFTIARPFVNNSGADIDVKEVGLVGEFDDDVPNLFYVLLEHTLLSFTIANGTSGTVTYTISVTC